MNMAPYHPDWLVTFWLTTPSLNQMNPHLFFIFVVGVTIAFYYVKKKRSHFEQPDAEEQRFQRLLRQKGMMERKLEELEQVYRYETMPNDQYERKKKELEQYLHVTTQELEQFTL